MQLWTGGTEPLWPQPPDIHGGPPKSAGQRAFEFLISFLPSGLLFFFSVAFRRLEGCCRKIPPAWLSDQHPPKFPFVTVLSFLVRREVSIRSPQSLPSSLSVSGSSRVREADRSLAPSRTGTPFSCDTVTSTWKSCVGKTLLFWTRNMR